MKYMIEENPYFGGYGYSNPRRRSHKRNSGLFGNPMSLAKTKTWTAGVGVADLIAGAAGMWASAYIPGLFVRDTSTTGKKILKIVAAILVAGVSGAVVKGVTKNPQMAKAATFGGMLGVTTNVISMVSGVQIGKSGGSVKQLKGTVQRIGEAVVTPTRTLDSMVITNVT